MVDANIFLDGKAVIPQQVGSIIDSGTTASGLPRLLQRHVLMLCSIFKLLVARWFTRYSCCFLRQRSQFSTFFRFAWIV